jgi:hypothetical protein
VPASFQIDDNFIVDQSKLLPKFSAIAGKIGLTYRWREKDTLGDIYTHGASHISSVGNPGEVDPAKIGMTTGIDVDARSTGCGTRSRATAIPDRARSTSISATWVRRWIMGRSCAVGSTACEVLLNMGRVERERPAGRCFRQGAGCDRSHSRGCREWCASAGQDVGSRVAAASV